MLPQEAGACAMQFLGFWRLHCAMVLFVAFKPRRVLYFVNLHSIHVGCRLCSCAVAMHLQVVHIIFYV